MESKRLLHLKDLARKLKRLLRNFEQVHDFIIFGSLVKGSSSPKDVDVAVILDSKDAKLVGEIHSRLSAQVRGVHLQIIGYEDFIKSKVPYHMLSEGFSVKHKRFISEMVDIKRYTLYWFDLLDLPQNKKAMFNKGLRFLVKETGAEKIGRGAVLVPVARSNEVAEFLTQWNRKKKIKELLQI